MNNNSTIIRLRNQLTPYGLAILSGLLTAIPFIDAAYYWITWICLVPLLAGCQNQSALNHYGLGLTAGIVTFLCGSNWISDFIENTQSLDPMTSRALMIAYWLYCAHTIALPITVSYWLKRHFQRISLVSLPMSWCLINVLYPMIFPFRLSDTQAFFITAVQGTDLLGGYGLEGVILIANTLVTAALLNTRSSRSMILTRNQYLSACGIIAVWFLYGQGAKIYWRHNITSWSTIDIAIVQPNDDISRVNQAGVGGYGYPSSMALSDEAADDEIDLIVWPESAPHYFIDNPNVQSSFIKHIQRIGTPHIIQDTSHQYGQDARVIRRNQSVLINTDGSMQYYSKIRVIPFGEYIPNLAAIPWLKQWFEKHVTRSLYQVTPGDTHIYFDVSGVHVIPIICYETTSPAFVSSRIRSTPSFGGTLLLAQSNDGWFGASSIVEQHIVASRIRAIENRISFVHAVNNGPSFVANAVGDITMEMPFNQTRTSSARIEVKPDGSQTIYSEYPYLYFLVLGSLFIWRSYVRTAKKHKSLTM